MRSDHLRERAGLERARPGDDRRTGDDRRAVGAGAALGAAGLTVLVLIGWRPLESFDGRVVRGLHAHAVAHPGVTHVMRVLTDWFWDPWTMRALAAAACLWLWRRGRNRCALRIAFLTLASSAVQQGLKALVGRERPVWPDPVDSASYAAYPSGHAMTATVVCGLLLWLVPRGAPRRYAYPARALVALSVLGVGFTRLYLGVHWPTDVLAGWLLGVALVTLGTVVTPVTHVTPAAAGGACPGRSPVSPRADFPAR